MVFKIPIETHDEEQICKVVWDGELYSGKADIVSISGKEKEAQNIRDMILSRQDLREVRYRSEGTRAEVKGWSSYEGVVGALRTILPALGFQIGHIGGDSPQLGQQRDDEIVFNTKEGGIE